MFIDYGGITQPAPAPRFDGQISEVRAWADCDVPPEKALSDWGLSGDAIRAITDPTWSDSLA